MTFIDVLVKSFWSGIATVLCLIPLWIFLLARWLFEPQGFWQELALTGLGIYVLGGIQIILLVVLIYLVLILWTENI